MKQIKFSMKVIFSKHIVSAIAIKSNIVRIPFLRIAMRYMIFWIVLSKNRVLLDINFSKKNKKLIFFWVMIYHEELPLNPKLIFYSSQGRIRISSLKTLQNFKRQNPTTLTLALIAQGGVLTLKDCLLKKCGGQLLVTITGLKSMNALKCICMSNLATKQIFTNRKFYFLKCNNLVKHLFVDFRDPYNTSAS